MLPNNDTEGSLLARLGRSAKRDLSLLGTKPSPRISCSSVTRKHFGVQPLGPSQNFKNATEKSRKLLNLELLLDEANRRAYDPTPTSSTITITSQDTPQIIVSAIKAAFYIYYLDDIDLEDTQGNTLLALYDSFNHDMTVRVGIVPGSWIGEINKGCRLHVGNLPSTTTEVGLRRVFAGYDVAHLFLPLNPRNNRAVGYAFVDVRSPDQAVKAISGLHLLNFHGRLVSVRLAHETDEDETNQAAGAQTEDFWVCLWDRCPDPTCESRSALLQHLDLDHVHGVPQEDHIAWHCRWGGCSDDGTVSFATIYELREHLIEHIPSGTPPVDANSLSTLTAPEYVDEIGDHPVATSKPHQSTAQEVEKPTPCAMYIHYTISEDRSGDRNSVSSAILARLGARESRSAPAYQERSAVLEPLSAETHRRSRPWT